ncbi:hypothetical protein C3E79_09920 [Corynebacterium liangguodongii]|uniref:Uncharacterized protein n=2 Tax=Corynebacterium liangguodongii TaxID=2079535 RepID=A0A2S0WG56_9CORY|nr:hypothetical protein C3E79_09920 [Corynebacterium liangguodongii]PWB99757.1 hypothetical protein DF219_05700 [Corynebacterium liangguodongii]
MLLFYLGGFHNPRPHDLDLAIIADNPAAAAPVEQALTSSLGESINVSTVATREEATDLLANREIAGAFVPAGLDGADHADLLIASGSSVTTAETVVTIFQRLTQAQEVRLAIEDVVPVDADDPWGRTSSST